MLVTCGTLPMYLNYKLMQLHETEISGSAKEKLQNISNELGDD